MQAVQDAGPRVQRQPQQGLDRCHVGDHQHGLARVSRDDAVLSAPNPVGDVVEALPARRAQGGVAQPAPVQIRVVFGGLQEGLTLPGAEVGLDQVLVDRDVQPERLGRRGGGVIRALQR